MSTLIAQDQLDTYAETVVDLKSKSLPTGATVHTKGYYTAGDGGGATYLVAAPQAVDGYGDHALANGNVALLQVEGSLRAEQWGASPTGGFNNSPVLEAIISAGHKIAVFGQGSFLFDTEVFLPDHFWLVGLGGYGVSELRASGNNNIIRVQNDGPASATFGHVFMGVTFASNGTTSIGVVGAQNLGNLAYNVDTNFVRCYFDRSLQKAYSGDALQNRWHQTVVGKFGSPSNMTTGIEIIGETAAECNANSIHQCHISDINGDGVYIQNGSGTVIDGMTVIEVCQGYLVNAQGFLNMTLNMYGERAEQAAGMIRFAANAGGLNAGAVAIEGCQLQVFYDGGGANKNLRVFDEGGNVTVFIRSCGFGSLATGSYALGNNRAKFALSNDSFFPGGFSDYTVPDITLDNALNYKRINEILDTGLTTNTEYVKTITHDDAVLQGGASVLGLFTKKAASTSYNLIKAVVDKDGAPTSIFAVDGTGDIYVTNANGKGLTVRSPDGLITRKISIDNAGNVVAV